MQATIAAKKLEGNIYTKYVLNHALVLLYPKSWAASKSEALNLSLLGNISVIAYGSAITVWPTIPRNRPSRVFTKCTKQGWK